MHFFRDLHLSQNIEDAFCGLQFPQISETAAFPEKNFSVSILIQV